ncbi:unnamed protein product [Choristocarpus tenellus]
MIESRVGLEGGRKVDLRKFPAGQDRKISMLETEEDDNLSNWDSGETPSNTQRVEHLSTRTHTPRRSRAAKPAGNRYKDDHPQGGSRDPCTTKGRQPCPVVKPSPDEGRPVTVARNGPKNGRSPTNHAKVGKRPAWNLSTKPKQNLTTTGEPLRKNSITTGVRGSERSLNRRRPRSGQERGMTKENNASQQDPAAPSQEEIRRMIERIRWQANVKSVAEARSRVQHREALDGTPLHQKERFGDLDDSDRTDRNGGTLRQEEVISAMAGDLDGVEQQEKELQEKAHQLESELWALRKRQHEVNLVKMEQRLRAEAKVRLEERRTRVSKEAEKACQALRREKDQHVQRVTAFKDDLHAKLERLCAMYEEVSTRLQQVEKTYSDAEAKVQERARQELQSALHREERAISQKMEAMASRHTTTGRKLETR